MNRKPRILLIPNVAWWIIGEMGKQIIMRFGDRYDFYFVPEGLFERRPELLAAFLTGVDAVHCLNESSIDLFRSLDMKQVPPIATWIHHVTQWSEQHQLAVEKSAALTVCTAEWKEYLATRVEGRVPITVVPHGVDLQFFSPRKSAPKRFSIPPGKFVVGFIGAKGSDFDQGRKGTDVLLDVVREAAKKLPNLHIVLCGPGWESELEGLGADGVSVSATGYIAKSDLPILYSTIDAYLLTSRVEGGPCTVFEAMACGTPVVSTRVGVVPELIIDGVNGFSAAVDDRESLLRGIVVLAQNPEKAAEIGANARQTVSMSSWNEMLDPLENVYDALVAKRLSSGGAGAGPAWMSDPQKVMRTSSAADAIANLIVRIRRHTLSITQAIPLLPKMLDKTSLPDLVRGFAMLRGFTYKPANTRTYLRS